MNVNMTSFVINHPTVLIQNMATLVHVERVMNFREKIHAKPKMVTMHSIMQKYRKFCLKGLLKNRQNKGLKDKW